MISTSAWREKIRSKSEIICESGLPVAITLLISETT